MAPRGERISSDGPGDGARAAARRPAGRVCELDDCGTRLSVYNPGSRCSLHAVMVVPRTRGRKLPTAS